MKYKDKNGNVYNTLIRAKDEFCNDQECCEKCGFNIIGGFEDVEGCDYFIMEHETEAIKAMGLEVITDDVPDPGAVTRGSILAAARKCVCGDREQDYGSPENNFQTIANLWIDYLSGKGYPVGIAPHDVAAMLALLKIARISSGHAKADNWIDLAGYAACGGEIEGAKQ